MLVVCRVLLDFCTQCKWLEWREPRHKALKWLDSSNLSSFNCLQRQTPVGAPHHQSSTFPTLLQTNFCLSQQIIGVLHLFRECSSSHTQRHHFLPVTFNHSCCCLLYDLLAQFTLCYCSNCRWPKPLVLSTMVSTWLHCKIVKFNVAVQDWSGLWMYDPSRNFCLFSNQQGILEQIDKDAIKRGALKSKVRLIHNRLVNSHRSD